MLKLTPLHFLDHRNPPSFAASRSARPSSGGLACSNSCNSSQSQLPFPRPNTALRNHAGNRFTHYPTSFKRPSFRSVNDAL